eukprot:66843-Pyramimonas_sp.AAC.1
MTKESLPRVPFSPTLRLSATGRLQACERGSSTSGGPEYLDANSAVEGVVRLLLASRTIWIPMRVNSEWGRR